MILKKKLTTLTLKRQKLITAFLLKYLKKSSKGYASDLHKLFNKSIESNEFPQILKLVDITPVHKKKGPLDKTNY